MRKRSVYDYRVTVWPDFVFKGTGKQEAEEIKKQIDRHVDGIKQSCVEFTTQDICEFCKREWEQDDNGQPVCCDKAVEEWDRLNPESIKERP